MKELALPSRAPNFLELRQSEVRTIHLPRASEIRSELHTTRDRKGKVRISEPSRGFDTTLSMPLNTPLIPLPILSPDVPEPFKAALNAFVAEERALEDLGA